MTTKAGNLIAPNDYCLVVSDKKLKGSGLKRGDLVYVGAVKPAPASKKDPYLQRIFAVVFLSDVGIVRIPKENNDYKAYLVDPRSLEKLPEEEQEVLQDHLRRHYEEQHATTD